jgi:hypothetical protein
MRVAIGFALLVGCSEPKPVAVVVPPAIEVKAVDAGAPAPQMPIAIAEDAGAPAEECKTDPCPVVTDTVDMSANGTELWFVRSGGNYRQELVQRRREDVIGNVVSADLRPSHIAHVYRIRGNGNLIAAATTEGVVVFDKTTHQQSLLATDPKEAYQVALDATSVYWVNGSCALKKVDWPSGKVTTLATTGETYCSLPNIALDATDVYFAADSTVYAVSKNGGRLRTLVPKSNSYLLALEVDDANAYLFLSPKDSQNGSITRLPKRGGAGVKVQSIRVPGNAYTMTSDDQRLYWLESNGNKVTVASMTKPDGKRTVLAETDGMAYGISAGGDSVYWVRWIMGGGSSAPEVFRISK